MTTETIEQATELVDRAEISAGGVLVEYSRTEAALAELRKRYANAQFDLTTTAGNKAARSARLDLVTLRTSLEKKRKELKAPAVEFGRKIDDEAKRITGEILALEAPIDTQIKADESRRESERLERERIAAERAAGFQAKLTAIRACATKAQGLPSARIANGIAQVEAIVTDEATWAEFAPHAHHAKVETLDAMRTLFDAAKAREDEAERVEAQRIENERIAAEQRAAAEALEAQQRALAEREAAIAAQQKALDDAKAEEAARLQRQQEAKDLEEAELRAAAARANEEADRRQREQVRNTEAQDSPQVLKAEPETADATAREIHAITSPSVGSMGAEQPADAGLVSATVSPIRQADDRDDRMINLGTINTRLGFTVSAVLLADLGFDAVMDRRSCLYRESDFPAICRGISAHVLAVAVEKRLEAA